MTSCTRKRELLLLCRHSEHLNLKICYKQYCKVLSKVVLAAEKHMTIDSFLILIIKWNIINEEKGKTKRDIGVQSIMVDNKVMLNQKKIANTVNKYSYFLSIANSIISGNNKHISSSSIQLLT
jgi:hypothetical protein